MKTNPNCKINLGLHVVERRPDGYHNLESIFVPVPLCDELEILPSREFSFLQEGIAIDGDPMENLCVKAYRLLLDAYPDSMGPVSIRLTKNIPFGAGLGGGSSDAAFTIRMLNELFSLGLSTASMQDYARRLGADCAFFVEDVPAYATQRGDVFEPIAVDLSEYRLVLVKPDAWVSTAEAYRGLTPHESDIDLREAVAAPIAQWQQTIANDFEATVFAKHPVIAEIKSLLLEQGALYASMSGSGSTVFGLFPKAAQPLFPTLPASTLVFTF